MARGDATYYGISLPDATAVYSIPPRIVLSLFLSGLAYMVSIMVRSYSRSSVVMSGRSILSSCEFM